MASADHKDLSRSGSMSPVREDHAQRKSSTGRCCLRNEFMIQTQIHSNIYSIKFGIGILAEVQNLHQQDSSKIYIWLGMTGSQLHHSTNEIASKDQIIARAQTGTV